MEAYVEQFLLPAPGYLNLGDADSQSAEIQRFAMILLSNANLSKKMFSSVVASLVSMNKNRAGRFGSRPTVQKGKIVWITAIIENLGTGSSTLQILSDSDTSFKQEWVHRREPSLNRHTKKQTDSHFVSNIFSTNPISALEKISIDQDEIRNHQNSGENLKVYSYMAHISFARKF